MFTLLTDGFGFSWVVGELDWLVGGLVLVEHLVGWFVSGSGGSFGRTVGPSAIQSDVWFGLSISRSVTMAFDRLLGCSSVCGLGSRCVG